MQSVLIIGKNTKDLIEKAQEIINENNVSKFDVDTLETEKQVGIGDIRSLQKRLFLAPLKGEKKAVIIQAFFGATTEAQNAFLKILEEPPLSTIIVILATSIDFVLPTVLSRCTLINLEKQTEITNEKKEEYIQILLSLKKNNASSALVLAQDNSKTREDALNFLEGLIISAHDLLGKNEDFSDKELARILKSLQKFYTIIKTTNVNARFALENLFLNL